MSPRTLGLMVRAYSEHEPHKRVRRFAIVVATLGFVGGLVLIFVARERAASGGYAVAAPRVNMPAPQQPGIQRPSRLRSRLSQQLDADRLRRNLGERFLIAGREQTTLTGMLTVGTSVRPVRIVRTQQDDGEQVEISIGNSSANLTWNPTDGAREDGQSAAGSDRALIERVVLDSPDQFVLAQLRRASYRLLARNVVPGGIKDLENYSGPAWDVIKVGEPDSPARGQALSPSRLYYINVATGLIDKVVSQEAGETIVATFSGWSDQNGERLPTRVQWRLNDQMIMELSVDVASYGRQQ